VVLLQCMLDPVDSMFGFVVKECDRQMIKTDFCGNRYHPVCERKKRPPLYAGVETKHQPVGARKGRDPTRERSSIMCISVKADILCNR
jgi:hypothetical protein